jgi:hypothetical protein
MHWRPMQLSTGGRSGVGRVVDGEVDPWALPVSGPRKAGETGDLGSQSPAHRMGTMQVPATDVMDVPTDHAARARSAMER